jgi:hypothetical protein
MQHTKLFSTLLLLFCICVSGACTPPIAELDLNDSRPAATATPEGDDPATVHPAFRETWQQAGNERVGPPLGDPLWLDGRLVQFFDQMWLAAHDADAGEVVALPQAADWQAHVPEALLTLAASPWRAEIALADAPQEQLVTVAPLQPVTLTLQIADYSGPAELQMYDARGRLVDIKSVTVADGQATVELLPRGALGSQWALALVEGQLAGARRDLFTLDATTEVQTGWAELDALYPTVRGFMEQKVVSYDLNGIPVRGYRSPDNPLLWLRDHVHQGRGFRYFEQDVTSLLDAFARAQFADGSFPDVLDYPELGMQAKRMDPESDLEYLFVQGVYEAWQMTGDDDWMRGKLPAMRRGLTYITSDPLRWDAERGLIRRPYTIDTWDFQYGPTTISPDGKPAPRHWIDDQTIWGIFHGDNTGLAYAMKLLARMEEHLGHTDAAQDWREQSWGVMQRLNALSWNGSFFIHFIPIDGPLEVPGVDTDMQLSLSNAYALNREVLTFGQGVDIVTSYYHRRDFDRAFAEWYSIDPPFPEGSFGMGGRTGERPGEYVNGGIMPLVGGELARGAFRYGAEAYGFDILERYATLIELSGASYLWYYPEDASPGISSLDTVPTDGWGSSAMLGALMEGAAGIEDHSTRYRDVVVSPRWTVAPTVASARVVARYGASDGYVAYTWERTAQGLQLDLTGSWEHARVRLLLPTDAPEEVNVWVDGNPAPVTIEERGTSRYAVLEAEGGSVLVALEL